MADEKAQNGGTTINADTIASILRGKLDAMTAAIDTQDVSRVVEIGDGVARVSGLRSAMAGELLDFTSALTGEHVFGLAQNLDEDEVGAVLFGNVEAIREGDECRTTGRVMDIPVGPAMLGRVVNPLGEAIDGLGPMETVARRPVEFKAPGIMARTPVCEPVQTGLMAIDAMIPVGRGQRELIIGDRKTGKTSIAVDTIINQADSDMVCIYVAIGQKASTVATIRQTLESHGVLDKTIIVAATASDSAPLQYIAPMAGAAIGEYFMYNGADGKPANEDNPGRAVLVVYDDLSKQAVAYRQMSLTLHRPPGREAYPGDIFYLHSRLLERACKLDAAHGSGSLTALPIIETQEGDVSAYIPTNVISITDGQIFLETALFNRGIRPAINVGISVSRVGGNAQIKSMKKVAGTLKIDQAQFRELESFTKFGGDIDPVTARVIDKGRKNERLLIQPQYAPMKVEDEVAVIYCGTKGLLENVPLDKVAEFEKNFLQLVNTKYPEVMESIRAGKLDDDITAKLTEAAAEISGSYK